MQELIEFIDYEFGFKWDDDTKQKFKELLEKEKQQIIHAFNCGESFSVDYFNPETPEVAPSVNYFIQSYQNK